MTLRARDLRKPGQTHRENLARRTTHIHDLSEAIWTPSGAFRSHATYLNFLRRLQTAHAGMGTAAARALQDAGAMSEEAERLEALAADIGAPPGDRHANPQLSVSAAWGVAYVLNGSCLGAGVMLKQGRIAADWPSAYMHRSASFVNSGKLKRFFDALNAADLDLAEAATAAEICFAVFARPEDHIAV